MKKIMVATDFSERSDRAIRRAILIARQFDAKLKLIHVVDDDQPRRIVDSEHDEATSLLKQTATTLREVDGLECETQVIKAAPFAGIVKAVADLPPDLLVIGPHRRQVLGDIFFGTTAERTVRSVGCPVLMVNAPPASSYNHVMLTTDLSDGSRDALRRFHSLGIGGQIQNSLLYVFDAPALRLAFSHTIPKDEQKHFLEDEKKDAASDLAEFAASLSLGGLRQIVRYEATAAQHEIPNAAEAEKADLIVLSTHGKSGLAKLFIGSVTEQVLRTSPIDVLAIPPMRGE